MSKRCKYIVYIIAGGCIALIVALLVKLIFYSGFFMPMMKLQGDSTLHLEVHSEYKELGVKTRYHLTDFNDKVNITKHMNMNKVGTYTIVYEASEYDQKLTRKLVVEDTQKPNITLLGNKKQRVFVNGTYQEAGYQAKDAYDGDLTSKVQMKNNVNMRKVGTYSITYSVQDKSGNTTSKKRSVEVCEDPTSITLHYNHDQYDNKMEEWWFRKSVNHKRTSGAVDEKILRSYNTYFQGSDEKVLYLTFDEGGNDITYIKEIANVLKKNDVVATYFLTRNYIKSNPEFMNQLVGDGNVIGNHTWHHYDMTTLANALGTNTFVKEITETEKTYMEVTGKKMEKIFRFPKGGSSIRAMKMVMDLGYRTYNWSHAYYDYASDVSKEEALKTMMDHYHNGAIYLLHPSNKGNYEAMDSFIKQMKEKGYRFETVVSIPKEEKKH